MKIMEGLRVNGVMVHAQDLLNKGLSEASEMEEAVLEEGPVGDMVFGNPKDKQRGRGTRRKECGDEKKTSAENAGGVLDAKWTGRLR
ncbi:hypothetical protein CesoFtcFv8_014998 [Champsocephalus esox]|uniref:Uncharacterized protein n=1 Tax=Champsocephalus esox TaxID=159716 RepID=A0AAN8BNY3_9TELE|nr:hypothetical protein CesoFtcFv8_014998 [Champsocephalus esox]